MTISRRVFHPGAAPQPPLQRGPTSRQWRVNPWLYATMRGRPDTSTTITTLDGGHIGLPLGP
ncbi:hypothetical protein SAZ11_04805 [Streptomyces sp. FXJ1.4098]|nr:hypothetical protein [Streptomyces sp. FXJ1.4098]